MDWGRLGGVGGAGGRGEWASGLRGILQNCAASGRTETFKPGFLKLACHLLTKRGKNLLVFMAYYPGSEFQKITGRVKWNLETDSPAPVLVCPLLAVWLGAKPIPFGGSGLPMCQWG